jgi:23S rRNA (guanosine2251-2'-O)-methyltransferase
MILFMNQTNQKKRYLILHNIRSTYNVGAIFRTADAVGISKIYLSGYTPMPTDKFGRYRKDISKTALGAEKSIPWEHHKSIGSLISKLKKEGVQLIALEQSERSIDYRKAKEKIRTKEKTTLIFGNEVRGISKQILEKCCVVAELPMKGKKESLNVSVVAGIAMFELFSE